MYESTPTQKKLHVSSPKDRDGTNNGKGSEQKHSPSTNGHLITEAESDNFCKVETGSNPATYDTKMDNTSRDIVTACMKTGHTEKHIGSNKEYSSVGTMDINDEGKQTLVARNQVFTSIELDPTKYDKEMDKMSNDIETVCTTTDLGSQHTGSCKDYSSRGTIDTNEEEDHIVDQHESSSTKLNHTLYGTESNKTSRDIGKPSTNPGHIGNRTGNSIVYSSVGTTTSNEEGNQIVGARSQGIFSTTTSDSDEEWKQIAVERKRLLSSPSTQDVQEKQNKTKHLHERRRKLHMYLR